MNAPASPSVLCAGIARDGDTVRAVAIAESSLKLIVDSEKHGFERVTELVRAHVRSGGVLVAHEIDAVAHFFAATGVPVSDVIDTAGMMRALGLADSLEDAAALARVVLKTVTSPAVVAGQRAILALKAMETLRPFSLPEHERWALAHTSRMNVAGVRLDTEHARCLHARVVAHRNRALSELASAFDAFDTSHLGRAEHVLAFVNAKFGLSLHTFDQREGSVVAARAASPELGRFLELRRRIELLGRSATKLHQVANGPDRVHGQLTYFGAHTGRFTSGGQTSGRLNLHGLPKGDDSVPELREFRRILVPDDEESWVCADLATIEPRVLAFLAGEGPLLERFAQREDVYVWFSSVAFPGVLVEKGGSNEHLRRMCKEAVLGLGFLMGADGFHVRLRAKGFDVEPAAAAELRDTYKRAFPAIARFPWRLWRAVHAAHRLRRPCVVDRVRVTVDATPGRAGEVTISLELPTGRALRYNAVRSTPSLRPDGHRATLLWFAERCSPAGSASTAVAPDIDLDEAAPGAHEATAFSDGTLRRRLTPQMLVENVVQAVARDILVALAAEVDKDPGLKVRFHVHDEIVAATGRCRCSAGVHQPDCAWLRGTARIEELMSRMPPSLPRMATLPLAAEVNRNVRNSYAP